MALAAMTCDVFIHTAGVSAAVRLADRQSHDILADAVPHSAAVHWLPSAPASDVQSNAQS